MPKKTTARDDIKIEVHQGSLTDGDATVLVNASNTGMRLGSGVSHAIRLGCGGADYQQTLFNVLDKELGGELPPGEVCITDAGSHPRATHVLHAAVMDYREGSPDGREPDAARIEAICERLWPAVEALGGQQSIAMVALGAGTGGMGLSDTTEIACRSLKAHQHAVGDGSHIDRVCFYGFQLHEFVITVEVVTEHFDIDRESLPDEVWELIEKRRADGDQTIRT
jgi:O-acetyl-ADP-ribose deacetylase (regulator of RNase III)